MSNVMNVRVLRTYERLGLICKGKGMAGWWLDEYARGMTPSL
jgi:hypothetical protein